MAPWFERDVDTGKLTRITPGKKVNLPFTLQGIDNPQIQVHFIDDKNADITVPNFRIESDNRKLRISTRMRERSFSILYPHPTHLEQQIYHVDYVYLKEGEGQKVNYPPFPGESRGGLILSNGVPNLL